MKYRSCSEGEVMLEKIGVQSSDLARAGRCLFSSGMPSTLVASLTSGRFSLAMTSLDAEA